jgi:Transposase IS66 family
MMMRAPVARSSAQLYLPGFPLIDSNTVERTMRPIALGRRNYLFAGSGADQRRQARERIS